MPGTAARQTKIGALAHAEESQAPSSRMESPRLPGRLTSFYDRDDLIGAKARELPRGTEAQRKRDLAKPFDGCSPTEGFGGGPEVIPLALETVLVFRSAK